MCDLIDLNWVSGSGKEKKFDEIIKILKESLKKGSKIFIGSDSFISRKKINFATAICLYGGTGSSRYFFARDHVPKNDFKV